MKKLLVILVLAITLTLSGCTIETDYYTQDEVDVLLENYVPSQNFEVYQTNLHSELNEALKERYTQEEVDILLDEIMDYYDTKIEELEIRLQELEETE